MQKTYKLLIVLCSGLICFALPAKQPAPDQRSSRSKPVLKERHQRTQRPPQALGVILSFHKWPSKKEQRQISEILNQDGLTLSKKFKSFKALVFSWPKLKTKNKAQKVCHKLSKLKNLNYCEPDALLRPNSAPAKSNSETEAGSPVSACTTDCDNQTISPQNLLSDIQSLPKTRASCKLASSKYRLQDRKLTDYWAQEMVGADLLREEIEKAPPLPEDKHLIAVFDAPVKNHYVHVQNIISHEGPQAVLPALNSSQLKYVRTSWTSDYANVAEQLSPPKENIQNVKPAVKKNIQNEESSGIISSFINDSLNFFQINWDSDDIDTAEDVSSPKENIQNTEPSGNSPSLENTQNTEPAENPSPSFINNSMGWEGSRLIYNSMSRICPPSILVLASGNKYPTSIDPAENASSKNFDSILVGSLSTTGVVSEFSQEGEEVHILAPSDYSITSADQNGKYRQFGGTSGAAPLVTGSLAGFEWLSGYHPTAKEAKLLLERTAIPTIHSEFEDPQRNGRGMLNAYKLGRVAKRLKDRCQNDHQCFTQEIQNPENYQFSTDQSVLDDVRSAFPQCSGVAEDVQAVDCTFKKSAFKKLRQAVLLDTTNVELWRQLQCIYDQEGFSTNASAVGTTLLALSNLHDPHSIGRLPLHRIRSELIRGIERIGGEGEKEILQILAQHPSENIRKIAVQGAVRRGGDEGLALLQTLAADKSAKVRKEAAWGARNMGNAGLLQTLAADKNAEVRRTVARGAGDMGDTELLQTLAADKNAEVRRAVAREAGDMGDTELLQTLAADTNLSVRSAAIQEIAEIGGAKRSQIIQTLMTNNDENVRVSAIWVAKKIEGDEGARMLQTLAVDKSAKVRKEAARTAGYMGDAGLVLLQTLAADTNESVRNATAWSAGNIGGDGGLEILRQLTQDPSKSVREEVLMAAYNMGGEGGKEILRTLTRDSNKAVRERAARRLRQTN